MTTKEILDNYKDVAAYLDDFAVGSLLTSFEQRMSKHEYLLPFIGQFSAGKSRLINHLLGRDILPTKSVETTAFLTYISYGENEDALVSYVDGSSEHITIEAIHSMDQTSTKDSRPIAALYVTVNSAILRNGLTIVDTPGVNTLISEHVRMTGELLEASQYIVYVLGSSPSEMDITMIRQIDSLQIPVIFARNKADLIHKTEETVGECIRKEKESIINVLGRDVQYFALTNETGLPNDDLWNGFFEQFVKFITDDIVANIATLYDESIKKRMAVISEKFSDELNRRESLYRTSNAKTVEQLRCQQIEVQGALNTLNRAIEKNEQSFNKKSDALQSIVSSNLKELRLSEEELFLKKINAVSKDVNYQDNIKLCYQTQLPLSYQKMGQIASDNINKLSEDATDEIKADIACIVDSLSAKEIDLSCDFNMSVIEQISEEQDAYENQINEKIAELENLKSLNESQLEEIGIKKQEIDAAIAEYDTIIAEGKGVIAEQRQSHQVQFKTRESQLAKKLEKVGRVLNVATMFIPAKGWATIAGKAGKIAQSISKGKKLGAFGGKVKEFLDKVQNDAQAIAKQKMMQELPLDQQKPTFAPTDNKKSTNFFDYLNISHWMGKLGEVFDPPTIEIDQEAERQFEEACQRMQLEVDNKVSERLAEFQKMGSIKDEIQKKQKEQELYSQQQARLDRQLNEMRQEFEEQKQTKEYAVIKEQVIGMFKSSLETYAEQLFVQTKAEIEKLRVKLLSAANNFVASQLSDVNKQLEEIVSLKNDNSHSADSFYGKIQEMREKLLVNE